MLVYSKRFQVHSCPLEQQLRTQYNHKIHSIAVFDLLVISHNPYIPKIVMIKQNNKKLIITLSISYITFIQGSVFFYCFKLYFLGIVSSCFDSIKNRVIKCTMIWYNTDAWQVSYLQVDSCVLKLSN